MSLIKKLAGQTAIYGMSSIVGRLLNYLLVPMYTRVFTTGEYGVVTQYYAFSGFMLVLLSYRMESALFRFGTDAGERENAYATTMKLVAITTAVLLVIFAPLVPWLSAWLDQPNHPEYLYMFMGILATDVLSELPFARLRLESRPGRFATLKLVNIAINIGLNLFFLLLCPYLLNQGYSAISSIYSPEKGVFYVFLSNLIAGVVTFLLLMPEWLRIQLPIDWALVRRMMQYAFPLVIVSLAGVTDEMLSRLVLKDLLPGTPAENDAQLGIFGANYKVAVLISLFTQAYRYAAEPFFFKHTREGEGSLQLHADTTKWFTVVLSGAMLTLMLSLDLLQFIVGRDYRSGVTVVPLLLMANVLLGVYYNLSAWFRLRDKTMLGARISVIGALITVVALFALIPRFGLHGAAAATLICYAYMVVATWYTGRSHYPAPYQIGRMLFYFLLAVGLYYASDFVFGLVQSEVIIWVGRVSCMFIYLLAVWLLEKRKIGEA
jgi:O-antigen/teichoic acid export membrane protein